VEGYDTSAPFQSSNKISSKAVGMPNFPEGKKKCVTLLENLGHLYSGMQESSTKNLCLRVQ